MRMRILTRPENSLAYFNHQTSKKKLRIQRCEGIRSRMRMFLRMKCENFVLAAEIPCEWKFATKFASDCECDGVVHSAVNWNAGILDAESSQFTVCTSRFSPSLIHGLCTFFASNSRFMRLSQAALDTCLDSPFLASLSVHGLHFTVCAPSTIACKHLQSWSWLTVKNGWRSISFWHSQFEIRSELLILRAKRKRRQLGHFCRLKRERERAQIVDRQNV